MHFWIDKRSQACGFGRARVSASLSGTGPGVGLGFGHPPRRIGANKPFTAFPTVHRQQQQQQHNANQHHHHHHHKIGHNQQQHTAQQQKQQLQQQQHHSQQQQAHHLPSISFSNSPPIVRSAGICRVKGCNQFNSINNNTVITAATASNNFNTSNICRQQHSQQQQQQQQQQQLTFLQRSTNQMQCQHPNVTHNINNNSHQQPQQQQQQLQRKQQHQQASQIHSSLPSNTSVVPNDSNNSLNNNDSANGNQNSNNASNVINSTQLPTSTTSSICTSSTTASAVATATVTATAASAAALTGTGGSVLSTATTSISGRYNRHHHHHHHSAQHQPLQRINDAVITELNQTSSGGHHHHYDTRSYYHPQFGNMSVRHYQCGNNGMAPTSSLAPLPHSTSPRVGDNHSQINAVPTNHAACSAPSPTATETAAAAASSSTTAMASTMHEFRNGSSRSGGIMLQHLNSPLPHTFGLTNTVNVETLGPIHNRSLHSYHHQHSSAAPLQQRSMLNNNNMRATIAHNGTLTDSTETQPILTQLKCGMWASLILASIFVAGTKFYLYNQSTGLEVIIFCTFSATFFLAACSVSLCRLPKRLVTARHLNVNSRGLLSNTAHGVRSTPSSGSTNSAAGTAQQRNCFGLSHPQQQQQQHRNETSGPPPYHIAILLPEHRRDSVADDSPPPSYDKIVK